jgi:hypothetical protein
MSDPFEEVVSPLLSFWRLTVTDVGFVDIDCASQADGVLEGSILTSWT